MLTPALRSRFLQVVEEQIAGNRLPAFVEVVTKGKTPQLYHRDNPPPPPPPKKEQVVAGKLVETLRGLRNAGPGRYPTTVRHLGELSSTSVEDAIFKKVLNEPAFADHVVLANWKEPKDSLIGLAEDLTILAGSKAMLTSLLTECELVNAHAFPVKALVAKLGDRKPKVKNPLKAALESVLVSDNLDRQLPPGIGYMQVTDGKKSGTRHFFRLEHLRTGKPVTPAAHEAVRTRSSFVDAFEAAFNRLDRVAGSNNFVSLVDLRAALAEFPRVEFDAELQQLRRQRRYWLNSAEGYDGLTPEERNAAIREEGEYLLHASRVLS